MKVYFLHFQTESLQLRNLLQQVWYPWPKDTTVIKLKTIKNACNFLIVVSFNKNISLEIHLF
jgi:hypothetical protein